MDTRQEGKELSPGARRKSQEEWGGSEDGETELEVRGAKAVAGKPRVGVVREFVRKNACQPRVQNSSDVSFLSELVFRKSQAMSPKTSLGRSVPRYSGSQLGRGRREGVEVLLSGSPLPFPSAQVRGGHRPPLLPQG